MRNPCLVLSLACIATVPALGQSLQCGQATVLMVDSDYALAQNQQNCATLRVVGVLTASRRLILSSTPGTQYTVINATKGGNALYVGTGSGGSVLIPSGSTTVVVTADGLTYTTVNGNGGGGTGTVTSVAGIAPQNGNVPLTAQNVGAIPADGATPIAAAQIPQLPPSKVTGLIPVMGGTQMLSGGTATVTVPSGTALCTATDTSAIASVQTVISGTSLTLNGTGTDTIAYQCMGGGSTPTPTATTTTLATSSTTPTQGQSVTFTATVSPSTATGAVTFKDGSTTLGTGTLSSGTATYSTSSLAVGSHSITASYPGNSSYAASTSSAVTVTVASSGGSGGQNSDSFNYTGILASPPWTNIQGQLYLNNPGQLQYGSAGANMVNASAYTGTASTASQISCVTTGGGTPLNGGPALRLNGTANQGYWLFPDESAASFTIYLNNSQVGTIGTATVAAGHTYCAAISSADVITLTVDGTSQGTYTDSTHGATTGNPGIVIYGNGDGTGYYTKWTGGSN